MLLRRYHNKTVTKPVSEPKRQTYPDYNNITKTEISAILEAKGISFDDKALKTELYDLLLGSD